ncbi:hypothetical protein DZE40_005289 [Clostridium beijerinckii]|nr:hypothetical protein [Clostridium beijerinckii]NRY64194.1 hypothetical protein [Clostridium beijerinckii]
MSWKLSRTVRRRGKGSDYFKALPIPMCDLLLDKGKRGFTTKLA